MKVRESTRKRRASIFPIAKFILLTSGAIPFPIPSVAEPMGACCFPDSDVCEIRNYEDCNWYYWGDGTACFDGACIGACCNPIDHTCTIVSQRPCYLAIHGNFAGYGTTCQSVRCAERGACCSAQAECSDFWLPEECEGGPHPGEFLGPDTVCGENADCGVACCDPGAKCDCPRNQNCSLTSGRCTCDESAIGDISGDGRIDVQDFLDSALLCISGPDEHIFHTWCNCADIDDDNHVDLYDLALLQNTIGQ